MVIVVIVFSSAAITYVVPAAIATAVAMIPAALFGVAFISTVTIGRQEWKTVSEKGRSTIYERPRKRRNSRNSSRGSFSTAASTAVADTVRSSPRVTCRISTSTRSAT